MHELNYTFEVEQVEELHARALDIFERVTEDRELGEIVKGNVYNSILNMVAQVQIVQVQTAGGLPRLDIPGKR